MLAFYPEFDTTSVNEHTMRPTEIVFVLDMSCSMEGEGALNAKKLLIMSLLNLPKGALFNVVVFGDSYDVLFPRAVPKTDITYKHAVHYVTNCNSNWGTTNLWFVV